jgi:hypothetical protein
MTYSGNVTLSNGPFTFNTGGGNLSIAGNFAAGGRNVILASGIGAGTTTIGGNVTALGSGTGAALTVQSGVTGLVYLQGTVAGTSGITAAAGSSLRFDDNVTLAAGNTGTTLQGLVQLDGLTWSSHNGISMGTVTLSSGSVSLNSNNSALTFTGPVNGSEDLTLTAGTADISFSTGAGQSSRLDRLQVVSAKDVTFGGNVAAESFLQSAGTGTTTFSGTLNTNTAAGVNITGTNFRAVGTVTATANGGLTVLLSGSAPNGRATIEGGAHISSDGPVSITAPGGLTTGGNIVTTNDDITITAAVVLSHDVTIDSGPGAGNISFTSTIDGTTANSQALQLDGGSAGTVAVAGAIGKTVALRTLTLVDSNGATFGTAESDTIRATTATTIQNSASGANVRFNGALVTGSLTAAAGPYNLHLLGTGSEIVTSSLLNTGAIAFGNSSNDLLLFLGPVTAVTQSRIELFAKIHTRGFTVTLGDNDTPLNLRSAYSVIDTTDAGASGYANGNTITFGGVVEGTSGGAGENVDLNAGLTGDIVFMAPVGAAEPIGTMLVRNARNIVFPNVNAERLVQTTGTGTTTLRGVISTNSTGCTHPGLSTDVGDIDSGTANPSLPTTLATRNVDLGVDIATVNIFVDSNVNTVAGGVRLQATKGTGGIVTLNNNGVINSDFDVILEGNATTGPAIVVNALATGRLGGPGEDVLVGTRRRFLTTSDADVEFRGNVSMVAGPGQWHADIFFVDTGSGAGTITFTGTVDMNLSDLDVRSGQGNINFRKAVTEVHRLFVQDDNDGTLTGPAPTTVTFVENLSTELLITAPGAYNVDLLGSRSIINLNQIQYYLPNCTTFRNTGRVTLGNESTDIVSVMFGLSTRAALVTNIAGTVELTHGMSETVFPGIALSPVMLTPAGTTTRLRNSTGWPVSAMANTSGLSVDQAGNNTLILGTSTSINDYVFNGGVRVHTLDTTLSASRYNLSVLGPLTITNSAAMTFNNRGVVRIGGSSANAHSLAGSLTVDSNLGMTLSGQLTAQGSVQISSRLSVESVGASGIASNTSTVTVGETILADGVNYTLGSATTTGVSATSIIGTCGWHQFQRFLPCSRSNHRDGYRQPRPLEYHGREFNGRRVQRCGGCNGCSGHSGFLRHP